MDRLAAPFGDLITAIGRAVADAQQTVDARVLEHFSAIYDQSVEAFEPLRAIGYQPTWYQISEATAEMVLAFSVAEVREAGTPVSPRHALYAAPVDAGYQARFTYRRDVASSLKFRIVPVPEPAAASGA